MRVWVGLWLGSLLVVTVASAQPAMPAVVVDAARAVSEEVVLESVGDARAHRSALLFAESTGRVTRINLPADGKVEAGDILVELDDQREQVALGLAEIQLADARRLLDRYLAIEDPTAISPTTLDAAQKAVDLAALERQQAQFDLADRVVRAPFSGHIGLTDLELGDRVDPDTRIARLDDRSRVRIRYSLPEQYYDRVSAGQEATFYRWSAPNEPLHGAILQIDSQVDPATGTFLVEAEVPNDRDLLRPGMSLRAVTKLLGTEQIQVSETAVQWGDSGAFVWVVRNNQAQRIGINLVGRRGEYALIRGEIEPGELVVIEGVQRLRPGSELEFTTREALDGSAPVPAIHADVKDSE